MQNAATFLDRVQYPPEIYLTFNTHKTKIESLLKMVELQLFRGIRIRGKNRGISIYVNVLKSSALKSQRLFSPFSFALVLPLINQPWQVTKN